MSQTQENKIQYVISAKDDGLPGVKALVDGLDAATLEAAGLKDQAAEVAGALRNVGQQQAAIDKLRELGTEGRTLSTQLNQATAELERLAGAKAEAAARAKTLADAERQAAAEVDAARADVQAMQQTLKELQAGSEAAARGTDEYKASVAQAKSTIAELRGQLQEKQSAMAQAQAATKAAATEERALGNEYGAAVSAARKASEAVGEHRKAMDSARDAARTLGVDTGNLASENDRLKAAAQDAQKGLDTLAAGAEKVRQRQAEADQVVKEFAADLRKLGLDGPKAPAGLEEAFKRLGLSGVKRAETAVHELQVALAQIRNSSDVLGKDKEAAVAAFNKRLAELKAEAKGAAASTDQLAKSTDAAKSSLVGLRDQLVAGFAVKELVQAAAEMEQIQAGLQAVSGDAQLAGEQMDFVRRMATAAGVDVTAAGKAFLGLSAATKGTAVEGTATRDVFEAVTRSMARAGKSSAETQNALLALQQIASKGTVSMEELRQQLGEALPGALQAAANGLGITTQDLIKLVESGQLAAEDLFPALAKGLTALYSGAPSAQTLSQEITNVKNALVEMAGNIGAAGGLDALKFGAEAAQTAITFLGDTLIQTGQYIGTLASAVASLDFSGLSESFAQIEAESRERLLKAAEHNETLRNALKLSASEAIQAALAAKEHAQAVGAAGNAAAKAGDQNSSAAPSVAALGVAYAKVRDEVKKQVTLAEKEIEAVKARGQAAVAQASALNDEAAKRQAVSKAAVDEAAAMESLAQVKQTELNVLRAELSARQALQAQDGKASDARKKEISDLQSLIAQKQIDVDKTNAQAAASREKAKAQSEEAQKARAAQDAAQALAITRSADAKAVVSSLSAQKELARQTEELARLMGNEGAARQAKIQQLEIEAKLILARANVSKVEAEGSIAVAQAKLAELKAGGELTALKEAELNASIKLAQAKIGEANAMGQSSRLLERQLDLLRSNAGAAGSAGDAANKAAAGFRNMGQAAGEAAESIKRLKEINNRHGRPGQYSQQQKDEDDYNPGHNQYGRAGRNEQPRNGLGETQAEWQRRQNLQGQNAVDNSLMFKLRDKLQAGTLGPDDLNEIQAVVAAMKDNEAVDRSVDRMAAGQFSLTGAADRQEWANVRALLEQMANAFLNGGGAAQTVVNLKFDGKTQKKIPTNQKGAKDIGDFLKELEVAQKRS